MESKTQEKNSKGKKVYFLLACIPFIAVSLYNLLPKILALHGDADSRPPVYFSNSNGYYWIWNYFETQGDGILSRVQLQFSVYPPKVDEYLDPLDESEFEYYAWKTKKNKNFMEGLVNLHTKVITNSKYVRSDGHQVENYTQIPLPIQSYKGYGPDDYFGEKLDEILEDGALLSIKRLCIGKEIKDKNKESFRPTNTYDIQTISSANLTRGKKGQSSIYSTDSEKVNSNDLTKVSLCNVVKIPLTFHNQEVREIGSTKVFFIPKHYRRKTSSWLIWAYQLVTQQLRLFVNNKPSASVSKRCHHVLANFLDQSRHNMYHNNYFPDIFTSIIFCH